MFEPMVTITDDEGIEIDDQEDVNELCDGSCTQSAECRLDHICLGLALHAEGCVALWGNSYRTASRAAASARLSAANVTRAACRATKR